MSRIHLNIGSNRGDRKALIGRAVALLSQRIPAASVVVSDFIESDPWGFDSDAKFINQGVLVVVPNPVDPLRLLDITQAIEREIAPDDAHRNPDGSYRDRFIDIDIIDIDRRPFSHPRLTLPHPRATQRRFVMEPLLQLDPDWAPPLKSEITPHIISNPTMNYFINYNGQIIGPMSAAQVMAYGSNPNTPVSTDGVNFQPLYAFPELMQHYQMHHQGSTSTDSKRVLFGVLDIVIGTLGIQYFIINKVPAGLLTILLSIVTCGAWGIITLIQGIMVLCMSDDEFNQKYVCSTSTLPLF